MRKPCAICRCTASTWKCWSAMCTNAAAHFAGARSPLPDEDVAPPSNTFSLPVPETIEETGFNRTSIQELRLIQPQPRYGAECRCAAALLPRSTRCCKNCAKPSSPILGGGYGRYVLRVCVERITISSPLMRLPKRSKYSGPRWCRLGPTSNRCAPKRSKNGGGDAPQHHQRSPPI